MLLSEQEQLISEKFLSEGYVIQAASNRRSLDWIRETVCQLIRSELNLPDNQDEDLESLLNNFHVKIPVADLNNFRVRLIRRINEEAEFRRHYLSLARELLYDLVGNELAMQTRVNLSIQYPNDESSLLPIHADVWSGDSPFEVVLWVPLVKCHDTKSMFIMPPKDTRELHERFSEFENKTDEDIFKAFEDRLRWIEIEYGEVLLFNQNLPHGNRVNVERETRWSLNCRFKSVFTPYGDKRLGEFFEPVTLRAATLAGMDYDLPGTHS